MLMLLFYVGDERFAFPCDHVVEVIPRVELKDIPYTPEWVVGMLNFRGLPVPVIGLGRLLQHDEVANRLHTRIIVLKINDLTFGLLAERVTQAVKLDKELFVDAGMRVKETPFLDGLLTDKEGTVTFILLDRLFGLIRPVVFSQVE